MYPGTHGLRPFAELADRIKGAGVDVSGLQAKDRPPGKRRQQFGTHATLSVGADLDHATATKPQHAQ